MASRRAESTSQLQTRYNDWEAQNPVWARRLTGPEAANALGYSGERECQFASRRDMLHARRTAARENAMRTSGFNEATQKKLTSHELGVLHTSLSRPTVDPPLR